MSAIKRQREVVRQRGNQRADKQAKRGAKDDAYSEVVDKNHRCQNRVEPKDSIGDGVAV